MLMIFYRDNIIYKLCKVILIIKYYIEISKISNFHLHVKTERPLSGLSGHEEGGDPKNLRTSTLVQYANHCFYKNQHYRHKKLSHPTPSINKK